MIGQRVEIWKQEEYSYADAYGFIPIMVTYMHEDEKIRPAMLVVPGGAYRYASPSEGDVVARWFYKAGYNVFVLAYTVNYLEEPLGRLPLNDISRAMRRRAGWIRIKWSCAGSQREDISQRVSACIIKTSGTAVRNTTKSPTARMQRSWDIL